MRRRIADCGGAFFSRAGGVLPLENDHADAAVPGTSNAGCTCSLASSSCRCRGCCDVAVVVVLLLLLQLSSSSSPWTSKSRLHFPSHSAFVRSLLLAREASGSISFCLFFGAQQVQLLKIPEFAVGGKMSTKKNLLPMVRHDKQVVFKQNSALRILWY